MSNRMNKFEGDVWLKLLGYNKREGVSRNIIVIGEYAKNGVGPKLTKEDIMKKLFVTMAAALLLNGLALPAMAWEAADYQEVYNTKVIDMLKSESNLEEIGGQWYSPLAKKYDNKPVQLQSLVTDKLITEKGERCLILDSYTSEQRIANWYRAEDFKVKVFLAKDQEFLYDKITPGTWLRAFGYANIDYHWGGMAIDKKDQEALRGLANFQGNGRGSHIYSFEIRNAKVVL